RSMDDIRLLLFQIESQNKITPLAEYSAEETMYNANLILEAGLACGPEPIFHGGRVLAVELDRLTWQGHDFLDAARDETLWKKAKQTVMKPAASYTFEIVKEYLKAEIRKHLGA